MSRGDEPLGPRSEVQVVEPFEGPLDATTRPPGSKSITNRALVAAALATGASELRGALLADDTEAMISCLSTLGATIQVDRAASLIRVEGTGGRLVSGPVTLDARLSGTTSRFLMPVLAGGPGPYLLDGGSPLRARPMADGIEATRALAGVVVEERGAPGHLPVMVRREAQGPNDETNPDDLAVRGDVSSQFLSGLLLAAPVRPGGLTVELEGALVSEPYVDMTLAVMEAFGATSSRSGDRGFRVEPGGYFATQYDVEPDASAASYFFAAAAICGGRVRVEGLSRASLQGDVAFVDLLERMGAKVSWGASSVSVESDGLLHGIEADLRDLSDTAPTLAAMAVFADSPTTVSGIGFVRAKESDRIAAVVTELRRCGLQAEETDDGFVVNPGMPQPARIQTYDDHRMAMSFALLGLRAPGIEIADPHCVDKTFPGYFDALEVLRP